MMYKKMWKTLLRLTLLVLFVLALSVPIYARADINTHSIIGDFFNKVFSVRLGDGSTIFDNEEKRQERESINNMIFDGTSTKTYGLYDRFGGDINFVPYLGETRIETGLFDAFYQKILDNDDQFSLSIDDIRSFFEQTNMSNNIIYTNRPNILSNDDIESGLKDPRVEAYSAVNFVGGEASLGNLYLGLGKTLTGFVAFLSGGGLYKEFNDIFEYIINHGLGDLIETLSKVFLPLLVALGVIGLVSMSIKLVSGKENLRSFVENLLSGVFSLAFIFVFMYNPTKLSNILFECTKVIDNVLDSSLSTGSDEVISKLTGSVRESVLWKVSVFEPWCYGMFDDKYENLYTQYAKISGNKKKALPQSNDDVMVYWEGGVRYNSTAITGDVKVPVGMGKYVQNWAALAWSCQSIYHIDATELMYSRNVPENWPKAELTPMNNQIYVDNFRWIDAYLNISPEYKNPGKVTMNYSNSRNYKQNFVAAGLKSLFLSLLMLPIMLLGLRKAITSLKIIVMGVKLLYMSAFNFLMPKRYDILENLKKALIPMYDYVWWSLACFTAIVLYKNMAGDNMAANIIWLVCGVYINMVRPVRTTARMNKILNKMKMGAKKITKKIKGSFGH